MNSTKQCIPFVDYYGLSDLIIPSLLTICFSFFGITICFAQAFLEPIKITEEHSGIIYSIMADLNGDDHEDIITSGTYSSPQPIKFIKNLGNGEFAAPVIIAPPNDLIAIGDLDEDGDLDFVSSFEEDQQLHVVLYEHTNLLNFVARDTAIVPGGLGLIYGGLVDWNNDQVLDVVFTGGRIALHTAIVQEPWVFSDTLISRNVYYEGENVELADLDGDMDLDIIFPGSEDDVYWIENVGESTLEQLRYLGYVRNSFNYQKRIVWGDLNLDGLNDVILTSNRSCLLYENIDLGDDFKITRSFFRDSESNTSSYKNTPLLADLDLDGDLDFIVWRDTGGKDQGLFWFENIKEGIYGEQQLIHRSLSRGWEMFARDLNGDEYPEVIVRLGDGFYVYPNNFAAPNLSGTVYQDVNNSSVFDTTDLKISGLKVTLMDSIGQRITTFTNRDGRYKFFVDTGRYELAVAGNTCWGTEMDTLNRSVEITNQFPQVQDIRIEMNTPAENQVSVDQENGRSRCDSAMPYWINLQQEGCDTISGQLILELDTAFTLLESLPPPDTLLDATLIWTFNDLPPNDVARINLKIQVPDSDFVGDTLHARAYFIIDGEVGTPKDTSQNSMVIRCSYDPNDKLVIPFRDSTNNYTLFGEQLFYTVRFQNTGNDTAYHVSIQDQLDDQLDWNTFNPLSSSHDYEVSVDQSGLVTFEFPDINLVDSTTNNPGSNGFVKYCVFPKQDLAEMTVIENLADIYFDANPPIRTNTTINTLVAEIPNNEFVNTEQNQVPQLKAYPNPFKNILKIDLGQAIFEHKMLRVQLIGVLGNTFLDTVVPVQGVLELPTDSLPVGTYCLIIQGVNTHKSYVGLFVKI